MRVVKLVLWILLLTVIKTVFVKVLGFGGIMPEPLMAFAVIFAFHEYRLSVATYVILACGMIAGSCIGESFAAMVLVTGAAGIVARGASMYFRFIPKFVRCLFIIAAAALVYSCIIGFAQSGLFTLSLLLSDVLPYVIYTAAAGAVIYPIIVKTLFREDKNKKLLMI